MLLSPSMAAVRPLALVLLAATGVGCASPYHADRGALFGGLTGAGVGALVGNAVGHTGAGALVGAGVGAMSGAAIGSGLDEIEARNRAEIEARLGRQVRAGAVSIDDVVAMTHGGVDDSLIINHIRAHGMTAPPSTGDLIFLGQQGVSPRVVEAMQRPVAVPVAPVAHVAAPPAVIVEEHYYGPPVWRPCPPPYYHGHYHRHRPGRVGFGFSYHQ